MALESETTTKNDGDEDDFGCYFLQPSSSPYNITEKVQQANFDLFTSTPQSTRSAKVKFREDLISFEPDLTDDDVNSIESDHAVEEIDSQNDNNNDYETQTLHLNILRGGEGIYDIDEEEEDEEAEGVIFEEEAVISDDNLEEVGNEDIGAEIKEIKTEPENDVIIGDKADDVKTNSSTTRIHSKQKSVKRKKRPPKKTEVQCRDHCIERIDSHLSISIKKLEIHEKNPINLPPLQLHQRKCCDEIRLSLDRNLPIYNGCRSEYGLTSRQLKNKYRHMEMIRQKEMARQKLIEEFRALKIQQNEEVFCQWLKEVSYRQNADLQRAKYVIKHGYKTPSPASLRNYQQNKSLSPSVVNINKDINRPDKNKDKERPKTAGFVPKTSIKKKKRPHTTQSCVYIEVPPDILKKGLHIGDLLITNSKELTQKLHILSVS